MESLAMNTDTATAPKVEEAAHASRLHLVLLLLVLAVTFVAYSGSLGYDFVYDDGNQIIGNRYLTSWSYLPRYFTEHSWSHLHYNSPGIYYRPLVLLWLRINYGLFGLNTTLWHLVTVLAYLAAVAMVYRLANRLFRDKITAVAAAMFFGLCPLHIETAAWISGVTEPLLALLIIPSFLFYLKSHEAAPDDRRTRLSAIAASVVAYSAALLMKETAVILPALIVAYELICGSRSEVEEPARPRSNSSRVKTFLELGSKSLARIVPFIAVTIVYLIVRVGVMGNLINHPVNLPLTTKLLTIPLLLWEYVKLLVWPVGLSEFYDTPYVESPGLIRFVLPLAAVVLLGIGLRWAILRVRDQRDRRILAFACAWMLIPMLPVLNAGAFRQGDLIHDRYLFLPSIGFAMLAGYGLRRIRGGSGQLAGLPSLQALAALVLGGALGLATAYQHVYWANDIVLFHHSLSVAPGNQIAQNDFGNALSKREMYNEAVMVFEDLVAHAPANPTAQYNLGYNYFKAGRYKEAVPHLATAVQMVPQDERHLLTLGVTLFYLDRYELAEQALREGIRLRRDGLGLHYALGAVLKETGRLDEALDEFNQELAYNPEYVSAYDQIEQIKKRAEARPQTRVKPRAN